MDSKRLQLIRHFRKPAPMREVSVVVHRDFVKKRLIEVLKEEIITAVPDKLRKNKSVKIVPI